MAFCKRKQDPLKKRKRSAPLVSIRRSRNSAKTIQPSLYYGDNTIEAIVAKLDDDECYTLHALMARWPSIRARTKGMRPHLPKKTDTRPTLVLDLDETLLHTYRQRRYNNRNKAYYADPDYVVYAEDGRSVLTAGTLRPGVTDFLVWASLKFEIVVWTAGDDDYAAMVSSVLDPEKKLIAHILTRRTCIRIQCQKEAIYIKDLYALGRDLKRTFLVDNTPHVASLNFSNLIPIAAYQGQTSDNQLKQLRRFLESHLVRLRDCGKDLRTVLHRQFDLKRKLRERVFTWKTQQSSSTTTTDPLI